MQVRFGTEVENIVQKYTGESDPTGHVDSAGPYGVQYQRQNGCTYLYTHWTQFQRTGIWNWKCAERQQDGMSWSRGSKSHLHLNMNPHQ
jgi:hypothetical protein